MVQDETPSTSAYRTAEFIDDTERNRPLAVAVWLAHNSSEVSAKLKEYKVGVGQLSAKNAQY